MDEFLARFANPVRQEAQPVEEIEVENTGISFFSKPERRASRKKAFAVHLAFDNESREKSESESESESSSSSSSSSSSDSDSRPSSKSRTRSRKRGLIVDKTKVEKIDIHEFISAIQRGTDIQIGKPDTGSLASCSVIHSPPKANSKPGESVLETFPIRKLGFMVQLKMSEPHLEVDIETENKGSEKEKKKRTGEPTKKGNRKDKGDLPDVAVKKRRALEGSELDVSGVIEQLNKMRSTPQKLTASNYYMNNRKYFSKFITEVFERLAKTSSASRKKAGVDVDVDVEAELEADDEFDCSTLSALDKKPFSALYHQRVVREYMNAYSPYRGLLLYHGLGSGKTCSSIVIAEGLSSHKKIIVMTPASLQKNYIEEIKKCGDSLFKLDQHWVFFPIDKVPKEKTAPEYEKSLLKALGFPEKVASTDNIVRTNKGVWFAEHGKPGNYHQLSELKKMEIDAQIDRMIHNKYRFINYNGIRITAWRELMRQNPSGNYFDDSVIIVDEAHNLVSRIVNKIKSPKSLSMQIYKAFLSASNSKVVLLTGTPIINYPNELGIMFNILRGYINTFNFTLDLSGFSGTGASQSTVNALKTIFNNAKEKDGVGVHDYLEFKQTPEPTLTLTRNPFGFVSHRGSSTGEFASVSMSLTHGGDIKDEEFVANVGKLLDSNKIRVTGVKQKSYTALPDRLEDFNELFIKPDGGGILNPDMFSRRIIGLTSYFRSAQEKLLPRYNPNEDFILFEIEMSNHQFSIYKEIRENERKTESNAKRRKAMASGNANDLYAETSSTYRIFSRACCNFAFPEELPRPLQISDLLKSSDKKKKAAVTDAETGTGTESSSEDDEDIEQIDENEQAPKSTKKPKPKQKTNPKLASKVRPLTEREFEGEVDDDDVDDAPGTGKPGFQNQNQHQDGDQQEQRSSLSPTDIRSYGDKIKSTVEKLARNADEYLSLKVLSGMYSPKFAQIYQQITDSKHVGLHLLYSQFRTLEGIGIFKLVMDANGYAEFKIRKNQQDGTWSQYYQQPDDAGKPMYALYTGTESKEEKEIIRNVFNSSWDNLPNTLKTDLMRNHSHTRKNIYGGVIKLLMITASGAEGINLRNVRYVHIMEPYWHPVRTEQIIGRANRICSHYQLPEELRTVNVFLYVMKFTQEQLNPTKQDKQVANIKTMDESISTDQKLLDTSSRKQLINQQLLTVVKASAVDCAIHKSRGGLDVQCFQYKSISGRDDVAYVPDVYQEQTDANAQRNQVKTKAIQRREFQYIVVKPDGSQVVKRYLLDQDTNDVYEEKEKGKPPIRIGMLVGNKVVET